MFKSIKTKLIFAFITINFLSVILTAFYARYIQKRFEIERAEKIALNEVNYLTKAIKNNFKLAISDLLILRDLPDLQQFINNPTDDGKLKIEKIFINFAKYHKIFYQIRLLDLFGKEIIRINCIKTPFVVPDKELQVKFHRYYFQAMLKLKKGEVYISPFDLNVEHHKIEVPYKPVIRIGIPIFNKNNNSSYFLIVNVDGNLILNLFKSRENRKLGKYFLIDCKGNFIYHPNKEKRFAFMFGKNETIFKEAPYLKDFIKNKKEGVKYFAKGIKHFSIVSFKKFKPISKGKSPEFAVIYSIFDPELLIGFNKYFKNFIIFTLIILLISLIISTFISFTISKPILKLAKLTKKIKDGDLSARVDIRTNDELGILSENFNKMTEKLKHTITQLKSSEEKYRNLFENTQDTVFLIDFLGNIKELNRAGHTLFGIENINNRNIFEFIKDNFIEQIKEEDEIHEKEIEIFNLKGEKRFGSIKAQVRDKDFIQGIIRDITELKKRHEERLKTKRLIEEQIILAEERERRNIGQLIHEQLAQDIAFLHLKTEELYEKFNNDSILQILNTTNKMLKQIRGTIFDLCPVILDEHGLISAIRCYCENFEEKSKIKVLFYTNLREENIPLTQTEKFYLFRIVKELLNNVLKYSGATEVVISFLIVENVLRLVIDDNGKGFNVEKYFNRKKYSSGIGLFTVKKWVEHFKGNFYIESAEGEGTRAIIEIPEKGAEND